MPRTKITFLTFFYLLLLIFIGLSQSVAYANGGQVINQSQAVMPSVIKPAFIKRPVIKPGATTNVGKPILQSIRIKSMPSDVVRVDFTFANRVSKPSYFATEEPARIIVDFPNTTLNLLPTEKQLPVGVLRNYEAIEADGKTRVVFNLTNYEKYNVQIHGMHVLLDIAGAVTDTNLAEKKQYIPVKARPHVTPNGINYVKTIDFNRSPTGSGQVAVHLSRAGINTNVQDKGGLITVKLYNTHVPTWLQRKFDVTAFGTAVQDIEATNRGQNALIIVKALQPYEQMTYQIDDRLIIDVKGEQVTGPGVGNLKVAKKYVGQPLSLNFQSIPIRSVLQLLAQFANVNMVVSDSVIGDITLRLQNVPWDQALDIIMQTRGLGEQKIGDTYIIAPASEIAKQEKEALQTQQQIQVLEPLQSELIQINYGKASEIAALLKSTNQSILSDRGTVSVDARTNTLWVQDTPQKLAEIRKLVTELDIPVRQVLIEARIVNISKDFVRQLGIRWGVTNVADRLSGTLNAANQIAGGTAPTAVTPDYTQRLNVDLPATGVGVGGGAASIGLALARLGNGNLLDLELSALQTEGEAKIISSPRLITANQQQAEILAGQEIPYQQSTSSGATSVAFKNAVLSLKVTPQITPDNRVILDLDVNQDKRGAEVLLGVPSIDTQQIHTQVLVNNGQTLVLGGIFQKTTRNNVTRVPFLSDIPLLGYFFRYSDKETHQTELLIFITPKIIKQSFYQQ